ncbi:MAG: HAD hydrolase family protein [Lachnospiraceae bacterium]|nr:HAD hydrolase family protein [Lachnospiraceae bacterium]MDY4971310.1 HAD hydrolase family protein [Lachnospiraceae bacterium]
MNMKIVFFDIDGTLYYRGDRRGIPQSTLEAIRQLQADGNQAVICTGRCMSCIEPYIQNIGFDGYIAGCGTHIIHRGRELWYQVLDREFIRRMNRLCREEQMMPVFEGSRYLYVDEPEQPGETLEFYRFYKRFYEGKVRPVDCEADDICKLTVRLNPWDEKGTSEQAYISSDTAGKERIMSLAFSAGMEALDKGSSVEIFPAECGKGAGIRRFLTLTGYAEADTYAFGDGINDITMMEQVDFGVALGHADPELVNVCFCETDDLYEDGIYNACRRLHLIS